MKHWFWTVMLVCLAGMPARAERHLIRPDGQGVFPTIQAAINGARAGDIIILAAGTYSGPGNRDLDCHGKAVSIRSRSGNPDDCVIDCAAADWSTPHRGFWFHSGEDSSTSVRGVTVRNGRAPGDSVPAGAGGAVLCLGASPTLRDCRFVLNRATLGGGVACAGGSSPRLIDCLFSENTAAQGGGLHVHEATPHLTNCLFIRNSADRGGGLACFAASPVVRDCTFDRNLARGGGGMSCEDGSSPLLLECLFCGNQAELGGGLSCDSSSPDIAHCTFAVNAAGAGGGINWIASAGPRLRNCIIAFGTRGEALGCDPDRAADLACCLIFGNGGGDWVGALAELAGRNGNLRVDPGFANLGRGNFRVRADSPCRAAIDGCGHIGAREPRRSPP